MMVSELLVSREEVAGKKVYLRDDGRDPDTES